MRNIFRRIILEEGEGSSQLLDLHLKSFQITTWAFVYNIIGGTKPVLDEPEMSLSFSLDKARELQHKKIRLRTYPTGGTKIKFSKLNRALA